MIRELIDTEVEAVVGGNGGHKLKLKDVTAGRDVIAINGDVSQSNSATNVDTGGGAFNQNNSIGG
jgi:hypothetical protein